MYSWSKDFPTLTELFFGKEEAARMLGETVEEIKDPADDIPEVMTEEL